MTTFSSKAPMLLDSITIRGKLALAFGSVPLLTSAAAADSMREQAEQLACSVPAFRIAA